MPSLATRNPSPVTHNEAQGASLWSSFRIQLRVIGALTMREVLTRYGRHNIGFMWLFVEPMLFTLGVTVLWNAMHLGKGGLSVTAFVLTGYSTLLLWRNMPNRCVNALQPNYSLMFHRQVRPVDVYTARIILEVAGATISLVVLSLCLVTFGWIPMPYDALTMVAGWSLLVWFAAALALFVGVLSEQSDLVEKIWHPMTYLMIPLSGTFFTVELLPQAVRPIVLLNPIVHCVELFREGYFGPSYPWHYSVSYVVVCSMALLVLALSQLRVISRSLVLAE